MVGAPTDANQDLVDLFGDQIITLGQVVKDLLLPGKEVRLVGLSASLSPTSRLMPPPRTVSNGSNGSSSQAAAPSPTPSPSTCPTSTL